MSTNFQKVAHFNQTFQAERHSSIPDDLFNSKADLIKFRLSLITEEYKELVQACTDKDITEVRDALSDILYVVYGMQDALGIDGDGDFDKVHNSNMSKVCVSEAEAQETVENYKRKYKEGNSPYDSPYFIKVDETRYLIKNESTGKVLKSINYKSVDLS